MLSLQSSIGEQSASPNNTSAQYSFGTSSRSRLALERAPGPGAYKNSNAIGNQSESRRATSARAVFGTATRDQLTKVCVLTNLLPVQCLYVNQVRKTGLCNVK